MHHKSASPIERKNYTPPVWRIESVDLNFDLYPEETFVTNRMRLSRVSAGPLVLDGMELQLDSVKIDAELLKESDYELTDEHLVIERLGDSCTVEIVTRINPQANTALEGLYRSSGNFCTQCEAEGFRKITYYLDRPDAMSIFTVTMEADRKEYPVLLSNGNLQSTQELANGRHRAVWHDPHLKPCYLFALVAGDFAHTHDTFKTRSGRLVELYIYVQAHNLTQCAYAMAALKRSMQWDEDVYGLEYDLDRFMIVAVDDFNMGAMENKGLNIFNSKYVLADTNTATDTDFRGVEAVIAHEYFHNWTGNRVTCRDWFQLSLKEGLTVFRDQEFSADMHSRHLKRIEDVRLLRERQFAEDSSPMAHPIRPDSYIEINNFYTLTVYEKGAEVIRMFHTLLGSEKYFKGIDLYFARHDGQAVTCDDFIAAMQDASGIDMNQFTRWYEYAGTPQLEVIDSYDKESKTYSLTIEQYCADTPEQKDKQPMHIPLRLGLLDVRGTDLPLPTSAGVTDGLLELRERTETFSFKGIESRPIPSLLREFSAPVTLKYDYSDEQLAILLKHDADSFNRWEASMRLAERVVLGNLDSNASSAELQATPTLDAYVDSLGALLADASLEAAFVAECLSLPAVESLAAGQAAMDIPEVHNARSELARHIASAHQQRLVGIVQAHASDMTVTESLEAMGERQLANQALHLLSYLDVDGWLPLAEQQFDNATNMTDRIGALKALCEVPGDARDLRLQQFFEQFASHKLVIDKWFSVQAMATHADVIDDVIKLATHQAFDKANPNRLRSLIGAFSMSNPAGFHRSDGRGYELLADYIVEIDPMNPQIAARLVSPLIRYKQFATPFEGLMRSALERVANSPNLSKDVGEIVQKSQRVEAVS